MKKTLLILTILSTCFSCYAQQIDSATKFKNEIRDNRLRDSLEKVFHSQPPYFSIKLEINQKEATMPMNAKFYMLNGKDKFYPDKTGQNELFFSTLPDSARFVLEWDSIHIETATILKKQYSYGARLKFGYYDNVLELRNLWIKNKRNEDFNEYTDIGQTYLRAIRNRKLIRAAKRKVIKPIEFIEFYPRSYGDGIVITFENIKIK